MLERFIVNSSNGSPIPWGLVSALVLVDGILKAIGLWKAIKNNDMYWFVAIFVLNTAGILPAIYLLFFQPKDQEIKGKSVIKNKTTKTSSARASKRK
jgi:hypothetical protein